jgi:hypothetical protein
MATAIRCEPKKLSNLDHRNQEAWKLPLADFIEKLYHGGAMTRTSRIGKCLTLSVSTIAPCARAVPAISASAM